MIDWSNRQFDNVMGRRPLRGLMNLFGLLTWGFASLHPRLYAFGRSAH